MNNASNPCPFCKSTNIETALDEQQGTKWGYAYCAECSCRGPEVRTNYLIELDAPWRSEAILTWNTRAVSSPLLPQQGGEQTAGTFGDTTGTYADKSGTFQKPGATPEQLHHMLSRWVALGKTDHMARWLVAETEALLQGLPNPEKPFATGLSLTHKQCAHPSWKKIENSKHECELCGAKGNELRYLSVDAAVLPQVGEEKAVAINGVLINGSIKRFKDADAFVIEDDRFIGVSESLYAAPASLGEAKAVAPGGWKLVPIEPDDGMQTAGAQAVRMDTTVLNKIWTGNAVYRAMIAAAPVA